MVLKDIKLYSYGALQFNCSDTFAVGYIA